MLFWLALLLGGIVLAAKLATQWLAIFVNKVPSIPVFKPKHGWALGRSHLPWVEDLPSLLAEAMEQFNGKGFQLWGPNGYMAIVPPEFAYELENLPEERVSFEERANLDVMWALESPHTNKVVKSVLRRKLNPQLSRFMPGILKDIQWAREKYMPLCEDWTSLTIYPLLIRIASVAMGRMFVGPAVNRTEEYYKFVSAHVDTTTEAIGVLQTYHPLIRPLVRKLTPSVRKLRRIEHDLCQFLSQARVADANQDQNLNAWMLHDRPESGKGSSETSTSAQLKPLDVARAVLISCFDGNMSSSEVICQALVDLSIHPEYIDQLRSEIADATDKAKAQGLTEMQKLSLLVRLDSFIQESQRLHPFTLIGFTRQTKTTITLLDGTVLGPGTNISVAVASVMRDPKFWGPDANEFRGFRFLNKDLTLAQPFSAVRHHIWAYGQGIHGCPGRFLATAIVKSILAELILKYDIRRAPEASSSEMEGTRVSTPLRSSNENDGLNSSSTFEAHKANKIELENLGFLALANPDAVVLHLRERDSSRKEA